MGVIARSVAPTVQPRMRVKPVRRWFGVSQDHFARALGVSRATVQRWEAQNSGPDPNTAEGRLLAAMTEIRDMAARTMGVRRAHQWLQHRAPSFAGKTPLEVLLERGPIPVRDLLREDWEGTY